MRSCACWLAFSFLVLVTQSQEQGQTGAELTYSSSSRWVSLRPRGKDAASKQYASIRTGAESVGPVLRDIRLVCRVHAAVPTHVATAAQNGLGPASEQGGYGMGWRCDWGRTRPAPEGWGEEKVDTEPRKRAGTRIEPAGTGRRPGGRCQGLGQGRA